MKYNRNQAKTLTNAKELELYDMARPPRLSKLTVKELKNLVKRSRTLRDKLTDVKRNQVRAKQAGAKARGAAPADRSKEKAELFAEVHEVFVARLAKVEVAEAKAKEKEKAAAKKAAPKKPLASASKGRGTGSRAGVGKIPSGRSDKATFASKAAAHPEVDENQSPQAAARLEDPTAKVEGARIARSGITRQRGHLSGVNKRRQGKRDSK